MEEIDDIVYKEFLDSGGFSTMCPKEKEIPRKTFKDHRDAMDKHIEVDNVIYKEYIELLKSGMFFEFFPQLSGEWHKDKKEFTKFYKEREYK